MRQERYLLTYKSAFSVNDDDLGLTNLVEHAIETGDSRPLKQPARRPPMALVHTEAEAVNKLLRQGVIQESNSPWASPIVLVRKKSGESLCVDYRRLNQVTVKDAYPLPKIQDCLDALGGSTIFSTLDMTSGYNQVPVRAKDIPKTAFVTRHGLYEFKSAPFGLTNMPATFQRVMELALRGLSWTSCVIYLDDVIVLGSTFTDHINKLRQVLSRLKAANFKLKPSKCALLQNEVPFLGHIVSKQGLSPNPDNIRKVSEWPVPENVTEVRQFLGLASYYRRFVRNFASVAKPLNNLTKKDSALSWTPACQAAFDQLKSQLTGPELMAYPRDSGLFVLDTDACDVSIGAVLSQMQDGQERVIAYGSRSLNKAETNYCVTDKELLAVLYFTQYYRCYLLGRQFIVRSDHQALKWIFSLREPKGRISRWIEILSAYQFELEYRPGAKHSNADSLSRCPNPRDCQCANQSEDLKCGPCDKCKKKTVEMMSKFCEPPLSDQARRTRAEAQTQPAAIQHNWFQGHTPAELRKLQQNDPAIKPILTWKLEGERPHGSELTGADPEVRHYWNYWNSLEIHDGVLFKRAYPSNGVSPHLQFVVPNVLRRQIFSQMHQAPLGGHLGRRKMLGKVSQRYYWFHLREDIYVWLQACDKCAANKPPTQKPRAPLGKMSVGAPMDRWATDIAGPFPITARGNRYIMVVTDTFSKWTEAYAIPDQTAPTCARYLVNEMISRFGCPLDIHSDQGRNYESLLFKELCSMLDIRKTRTTPRNPMCNGEVERFNRTLVRMLRAYVQEDQSDWDLYLGCLTGAYRATPHESTKFTPNMLVLGREIRLPGEVSLVAPESSQLVGEYVSELRNRLHKAHHIARQHLQSNAKRQKDYYDIKVQLNVYKPGDKVWYLAEYRQPGLNPKLASPYIGPCLITKKLNNLDYGIQIGPKQHRVVHHNKLKPYQGDTEDSSWLKVARRQLIKIRK